MAVLLAAASCPTGAEAAGLTLGAGGAYTTSPYRGHDDYLVPIPLIFYEGERFYLRGLSGGVHILKDDWYEFSLGLSYYGLKFDNGKTDNRRMKRLDDRDSTVTADLQFMLRTAYGNPGIKFSQDILGNSKGQMVDLFYRYPIQLGQVVLSPGGGLHWDSERQTDYYYGISSKESRRSGLEKYDPDSAFSPYLTFDVAWSFAENWRLMGGGRVTFLSDEIKDSPMVNESYVYSTFAGISYSF